MNALCQMTGISRAGYYRWRVPPPSFPVEMELRDAMQQVALEFPAYGYRRITMELNRRGFAVNHKWNHCGDELQCAWLGGTLLRAPQVKLCVEIFATKFILDLGLSRDCHWFLPLQFANAPINRYRTRTAAGLSGSTRPSSRSSSTIMWTTALMFFSASSRVRPDVAAPRLSRAGQQTCHAACPRHPRPAPSPP